MVLAEFGAAPLFVIPVRHPFEVAASLARRNGFSEAKALSLWLGHFLSVERDTRGFPRSFVTCSTQRLGGSRRSDHPRSRNSLATPVGRFRSGDRFFSVQQASPPLVWRSEPCQRRQTTAPMLKNTLGWAMQAKAGLAVISAFPASPLRLQHVTTAITCCRQRKM